MENNMMNPCRNLKKYGLPATLVGILAEHPATSGSKIHHFRSFFAASIPVLRSYACPAWQVQDAAWPIQQPQQAFIHWHWPVNVPRSSTQLSGVYCNICHWRRWDPPGSAGGIHRKGLQLRRFACLLRCSRGAPRHILWHGMFHTAFDRNIANSKAEFEVKPLQSRPKLALDTSTAKLRFNVNSLYLIVTFCNLPCLSIQEEICRQQKNLEEIASCCGREWREKPIWQSQRPQRDITPQSYINLQTSPQAEDDTRVRLVDCSKDCRLSL